jgi:PhnB protein
MKANIYINFPGTCADAFHYYERHLGAKIGIMMTHAQSPEPNQLGQQWKDKVLHARIFIADTEFMAADIPHAEPMRSAYLTLSVDTDPEAERIFSALADGGRELMPMRETFFATRFGQVRDRFGINWMILHERTRPQSA